MVIRKLLKPLHSLQFFVSSICFSASIKMGKKALLLGVFEKGEGPDRVNVLTKSADHFNNQNSCKLLSQLNIVGPLLKGKARILYNLSPEFPIISVVGIGPTNAGVDEQEGINEARENVREAVCVGARALRNLGDEIDEILVDDCDDAEAAAEGGVLGLFYFDELKSDKYKKKSPELSYLNPNDKEGHAKWQRGVILANGQNIARRLKEMPANLMTPTIFAETVSALAKPLGVEVFIRGKQWAEEQKMGLFLSVTRGSVEPPVFLELHYNNAPDTQPLALVGKGICFDTGGISLKPPPNMDKMRYDMGGAAVVVSTIITLARLKAKVNVKGFTPLCENMISGSATKPGDVITARNGKTVQVNNTDAEGRLVLGDALDYAQEFKPQAIVDLATLTGAITIALGSAACGVYSTSTPLFEIMQKVGVETGDRVWRMPLYKHYTKLTTDGELADLINVGKMPPHAGSCVAAAFLKEFVNHPKWIHVDIACVGQMKDEHPYICPGMSGRPMRTLVEFANKLFAQ